MCVCVCGGGGGGGCFGFETVPLVEFMYVVFTRMPGESYRRRLRSLLLCLFDVLRALINSLFVYFVLVLLFCLFVCLFCLFLFCCFFVVVWFWF